jgi:spermidine synthase
MKFILLAFSAFLAGGAIMMIEFIAVRFLQRSYGSTLDVWASEIAVCMAGLAIGNVLGGWMADRFTSARLMGLLMCLAAIAALPMEYLALTTDTLIFDYFALEFAWWQPLFAAGVVSFVPLLLLGTVLPQVIRLQARRLERLGRIAGGISAIATIGGIVGVLLTTALLGTFGVNETLWGLVIVLFAGGVLTMVAGGPSRRTAPAVVSAVMLIVVAIPAAAQGAGRNVIFERYSAYHHILVEDKQGQRIMWFNDAPQSTMSLANPLEGAFEYCDFFHIPVLLNPTMSSVLFVGLGGGSSPKQFLNDYPQMSVEVSEIDPMVVQVARQYFAVPEHPRLSIVTMDGRAHLRRSRAQYGAIIMDAYASGRAGIYLPYHLATQEFFRIAWDRLENGGCLAYNVIGAFGGQNSATLRGVHATLGSVFQNVYTFQARSSMNVVFVAQKIEVDKLDAAGTRGGAHWPQGPWLAHPLTAQGYQQLAATLLGQGVLKRPVLAQRVGQLAHVRPDQGTILTDNFAPVDIGGRR